MVILNNNKLKLNRKISSISDISKYIKIKSETVPINILYDQLLKQYKKFEDDIKIVFFMNYNYFKNIQDEKKTREVENRPYQVKLRDYVLKKYKKCVISNKYGHKRLDCAHIKPVNECNYEEKCDVNNVLLLRKDIHPYFDSYDLSINPDTFRIEVNLNDEDNKWLEKYDGKYIKNLCSSNKKYLIHHYSKFNNLRQ
jgi:hypothetical protein